MQVDFENDSRIQTAIRAELVGCTVRRSCSYSSLSVQQLISDGFPSLDSFLAHHYRTSAPFHVRSSFSTDDLGPVAHVLIALRFPSMMYSMDYDRILLLDGGKLVEFDTPKNLLAKPESHLSTLVAASADAEELRAIANEKI
jgi:hypothetical protein